MHIIMSDTRFQHTQKHILTCRFDLRALKLYIYYIYKCILSLNSNTHESPYYNFLMDVLDRIRITCITVTKVFFILMYMNSSKVQGVAG